MLLKNFFAKINFKKFLRVQNPEIFENFFCIKQQNSDEINVGVFVCQSMVKNMVIKDHILTYKTNHKYISNHPPFIIQKKKLYWINYQNYTV